MVIKGELRNGDKVMSITETAKKYNCGKSTAQKVLENLCEDGVLSKQQGKGFFINDYNVKMRDGLEKDYRDEMKRILLKYIYKSKRIGMTNKEIMNEVELILKNEDDVPSIEMWRNGD